MRTEELIAIQEKFDQGVQKLYLLNTCLQSVSAAMGLKVTATPVEESRGMLRFCFAGADYYVRVRVTDRDVDDVGGEYRVPIGWLDWGLINDDGVADGAVQSNYYDDRGILCELEKEEFYCDFSSCGDDRVHRGMSSNLSKLVGRSIALNNAR